MNLEKYNFNDKKNCLKIFHIRNNNKKIIIKNKYDIL